MNELLKNNLPEVILILLGFIGLYFQNYFIQKGKNLATKEDIEEITEKIENVKNEVSIKSQRKIEYINNRKNSILNFLDVISVWIDFTLNPLDRLYNNTLNVSILKEIILDLKNKATEGTSCYWKVAVYHDSKAVTEVVDDLYNSILKLHNTTVQFVISLERNAVIVDDRTDRIENTKNREYALELKEEIEAIHKKVHQLVRQYESDKKGLLKVVEDNRVTYIALLNMMLKIKINKPSP